MTDSTDPIARAAAMLNRGDAAGARALAEDALAGGSDSAALRNVIGVACCQGGDLQTGVIHLQRAVELHHGNNQLYPGSGVQGEPGRRTSSMPWSRAMTSAPLLGYVMA